MRYCLLRVDGFILNMLASGAFMLRFASRIVCGPGVGDGAVGVGCLLFFYFRGIAAAGAGVIGFLAYRRAGGGLGFVVDKVVVVGIYCARCKGFGAAG